MEEPLNEAIDHVVALRLMGWGLTALDKDNGRAVLAEADPARAAQPGCPRRPGNADPARRCDRVLGRRLPSARGASGD